MEKACFEGRTLTIKIKYSDFTQKTLSKTMPHLLYDEEEIKQIIYQLLDTFSVPENGVRLLGLNISSPIKMSENGQLYLEFE